MEFWHFLLIPYGMITAFAIYMTHMEQRWQSRATLPFTLLGYMLCLVWPLSVVAMLVVVQWRPAQFVRAEID